MNGSRQPLRIVLACVVAALIAGAAQGQTTAPPATQPAGPPTAPPARQSVAPTAPSAPPPSFEALAWLRGCWEGKAVRNQFNEQWQSARGGMMLGSSQMVVGQRTQDYTYLRIESRPDGLYYVAVPSGKKEIAFKLTGVEDDKGVKVFTFTNPQDEFPQRVVYRHREHGLLFAQAGGKVDGKDREVTYPMHRVDCVTGALASD